MTPRDVERFWSKIEKTDGCWPWLAGKNEHGYGRITISDGRPQVIQYAHRIAWEIAHGDPGGWLVLHRCDNPACCNPAHLFLGTQTDNMRDKMEKKRHRVAHGAANGKSKLTDSTVVEIRKLRKARWSARQIADHFGVHKSTVGSVLRGQTWRANAA